MGLRSVFVESAHQGTHERIDRSRAEQRLNVAYIYVGGFSRDNFSRMVGGVMSK